jgi:hypothetical protein
MRNKWLAIGGLVGAAVLVLSQLPASAAIVTKKSTQTGDIGISGLTAYQSLSVLLNSIPRGRTVTANDCGFVKLTNSSSFPLTGATLKLDGGSDTVVSSIPTEAAASCVSGVLTGNTSPSAAFKDANGNVYFTGLSDFSSHTVTNSGLPTKRTVKANACGIVTIKATGTYPITGTDSVTVKNADETSTIATIADYSALTAAAAVPICNKGIAFFPVGWE